MLHKEPKVQLELLFKLVNNSKYFDREGAYQQIINIIIDNKLPEKDQLLSAFNYMIKRNPDN